MTPERVSDGADRPFSALGVAFDGVPFDAWLCIPVPPPGGTIACCARITSARMYVCMCIVRTKACMCMVTTKASMCIVTTEASPADQPGQNGAYHTYHTYHTYDTYPHTKHASEHARARKREGVRVCVRRAQHEARLGCRAAEFRPQPSTLAQP